MAKRPALTEQSFLAHLFSPKRNPLPSGLRKTTLVGTKGGRTKARLAAFNRMSPASQEMLKRSGKREAYLKGETSLSEAKKSLREVAVNLGVAKPLPKAKRKAARVSSSNRSSLDARVFNHVREKLRNAGKAVNETRLDEGIALLDDDVAEDIVRRGREWDYGKIKAAARQGSEIEVMVDGHVRNPLWYH